VLERAIIESIEGIEHLEEEWRDLWQADPAATPFQSPDWLIPWTRYLWGGGKLQILTLRSGDRPIAVAPFFLWGNGMLSFLGSGISDYLGLTCAAEWAEEAAEAVVGWIIDPCAEWQVCDLQELRAGSPLLRAATRLRVPATRSSACPVIELRVSFEEQFGVFDAKLRRSLRVAQKKLRPIGDVRFVCADEGNREALLDRLFDLHTGRWQQRGESGVLSTVALHSFHQDATRRLNRSGMLRLYGLTVDDEPIAVIYCLAAKGRTYAYLSGFDPEWGHFSPGSLLIAQAIESAIAEGMREFDFLRNAEEYKYVWGAVDTFTERLLISRGRQVSSCTIPLAL
jgi:CelD/BcsL family acetyltransferase involved in cellulose biosynthesis